MDGRSVLFILALTTVLSASLDYEGGKVYRYSYETAVLFNALDLPREDTPAQRDAGVHLNIKFELSSLLKLQTSNLFKLQITEASARSGLKPDLSKTLSSLLKYPIYFISNDGVIGYTYVSEMESIFSTNVKKGVIGLFQMQQESGQRTEIDVSGECSMTYTVDGSQITKVKNTCKNVDITGQFISPKNIMGVSVGIKSTLVYQLRDNIINTAAGSTRMATVANSRTEINMGVLSNQKLAFDEVAGNVQTITASNLDEILPKLNKAAGYSHIISLLPSASEIEQCVEDCESPIDVVEKVHDSLLKEKLATIESAKAFLKMVRSFRNSGKDSIGEAITSKKSYYIVAQLIDIAAAAQTHASHRAIMDLLNFQDHHATAHPERFLFSTAFTTHPGEYVLRDILDIIKKKVPNTKLHESLVLGGAAVAHTLCKGKDTCTDEIILEYEGMMTSYLDECADDDCRSTYIRSLGNAGLSSSTDLLVGYIESKDSSRQLRLTSLYALRRLPNSAFTEKILTKLRRIFNQNDRAYDTSVRAGAMDVLLKQKPTSFLISNILAIIQDNSEKEFTTFVKKNLLDAANADDTVRSLLKSHLKDPRVNNYNVMAKNGQSCADTRQLAETKDANCTFGIYIENSYVGAIKQGSIQVDLVGRTSKQPFLNFGLYAEGLESFMAETTEGVDPTAGIAVSVMDVILPPVEFFRGMSGLMSAVWNAPTEPVTAVQGNMLLLDHSQKMSLSNGFIVDLQIQGVGSMDASGSCSISLWNRNSQSLVKISGGMYVEGNLKLESLVFQTGVKAVTESEAYIGVRTDVDFYDIPVNACPRMEQPDFLFKYYLSKTEKFEGVKKRYNARVNRTWNIPARTFYLNQLANEQCKKMSPEN